MSSQRIDTENNISDMAKTLPASWYCSKPLYELERQAVFLKVYIDVHPSAIPSHYTESLLIRRGTYSVLSRVSKHNLSHMSSTRSPESKFW